MINDGAQPAHLASSRRNQKGHVVVVLVEKARGDSTKRTARSPVRRRARAARVTPGSANAHQPILPSAHGAATRTIRHGQVERAFVPLVTQRETARRPAQAAPRGERRGAEEEGPFRGSASKELLSFPPSRDGVATRACFLSSSVFFFFERLSSSVLWPFEPLL